MTMREDSGELNGDSIGFGDEDEETKNFASPGPNASFLHANSSSKEPQNGAAQSNSKFYQRMEQEDALFNEKLFEGRAARRGDGTPYPMLVFVCSTPCPLSCAFSS